MQTIFTSSKVIRFSCGPCSVIYVLTCPNPYPISLLKEQGFFSEIENWNLQFQMYSLTQPNLFQIPTIKKLVPQEPKNFRIRNRPCFSKQEEGHRLTVFHQLVIRKTPKTPEKPLSGGAVTTATLSTGNGYHSSSRARSQLLTVRSQRIDPYTF